MQKNDNSQKRGPGKKENRVFVSRFVSYSLPAHRGESNVQWRCAAAATDPKKTTRPPRTHAHTHTLLLLLLLLKFPAPTSLAPPKKTKLLRPSNTRDEAGSIQSYSIPRFFIPLALFSFSRSSLCVSVFLFSLFRFRSFFFLCPFSKKLYLSNVCKLHATLHTLS